MPVTIANKPTLGVPQRPLRRSSDDAILGGVAKGFAVRLGVKERTVRILFSLSALLGGLGVLLYIALWLFLPRSGEEQSIGRHLAQSRRDKQSVLIGLVVAVVVLIGLDSLNLHAIRSFTWTLLLGVVGLFAIVRGASSEERRHLEDFASSAPVLSVGSSRGWRSLFIRVVPGIILMVIGLNILNRIGGIWGAAVPALIGAFVLIGGLLVILTPWWLQNVRDLSVERRQRVRMEERSAVIAHIHDSVLQTLTLIERSAANESDVVRLARAQERELRQWLFDPERFASHGAGATSFVGLVEAIENEIENDYGVRVQLVTVGDCVPDDDVVAVVAAAREAAINAAKWSGAPVVSIYAEADPHELTVFVRDTGSGFDVASVPADRQGIEVSIKQRLKQHGGTAKIRSTPGAGTEVQLTIPRRSPQ